MIFLAIYFMNQILFTIFIFSIVISIVNSLVYKYHLVFILIESIILIIDK